MEVNNTKLPKPSKCPHCNQQLHELVFDEEDIIINHIHDATGYMMTIYFCDYCGRIWLFDLDNEEIYYTILGENCKSYNADKYIEQYVVEEI